MCPCVWLWFVPLTGDLPPSALDGVLPDHARQLPRATPRQRARREAHAAMQLLCGQALGRGPHELRWTRTDAGRPLLVDADGWWASLSHADGLAAVAVAHGAPVGVDVEGRRRLPELEELASAVLATGELLEWRRLPAERRLAAFLRLWTRKEAVLKALGLGLKGDLRRVDTALDGTLRGLPPEAGDPSGWTLVDPPAPVGATAALAMPGPTAGLEVGTARLPDLLAAA